MWLVYSFLLILALLCNIISAFVQNSISVYTSPSFSNIQAIAASDSIKSTSLQHRTDKSHSSHHDELTGTSQAAFLTTVECYRNHYGNRKNWWGDFTAGETRNFYHSLLPNEISSMPGFNNLSLEDKAKVASMSRHAARLYARERCTLPGRLISRAFDGYRTFKMLGKWSSSGLSWNDLCAKYKAQILVEAAARGTQMSEDEIRDKVHRRILQKSIQTNNKFDSATGQGHGSKRGTSTKLLSLLRYL